jgi:hypothetical protein
MSPAETRAMVKMLSDSLIPIASLYELANTPWNAEDFYIQCISFAKPDSHLGIKESYVFALDKILEIIIFIDIKNTEQTVYHTDLSLCIWDDFDPDDHDSKKEFILERNAFDEIFKTVLDKTISVLGEPLFQGKNKKDENYAFALWQGTTGVFVLLQDSHDPQLGHRIAYVIKPWKGTVPKRPHSFQQWLFAS